MSLSCCTSHAKPEPCGWCKGNSEPYAITPYCDVVRPAGTGAPFIGSTTLGPAGVVGGGLERASEKVPLASCYIIMIGRLRNHPLAPVQVTPHLMSF